MVWSLIFLTLSLILKKNEQKMILMVTVLTISKIYISGNQLELNFLFLDSMGMNMAHLSIILSCLALLVYMNNNDQNKSILCLISGIIAYFFFHCNNIIFFFILFEASLIPLIILIIGWGKQPERMLAGQYIMIYTLFSSFPFLCFAIWNEELIGMFSMSSPVMINNYNLMWSSSLNLFVFISFILTFIVKVPMFFLHSWLPKAHVEASLEGSIILAGIMLKVGVYGIFRLLNLFPLNCLKEAFICMFCISIFGSVASIIMAISSDDLKMSVALSSVSHMNFLLGSLLSMKEMTFNMANFTMISHGFSSSMLFFFVTITYEMNNSRSLALVKGSMSKVPSILLFSFIFFSISASLPPSLSFLGEMLSISSIWCYSIESTPLICLFILFNSFFLMMNYGLINQSAKKGGPKNSNFELIFNFYSIISLMILVMVFFFPEMVV